MLLKLFDDEQYKPMKLKELCMVLGVPKSERSDLKLMLDQMISEGLITIENKGRYIKMPPDQLNGTFMATQKGFGFVRVEGMADDIFIPEEYTKNAFHEDKVSVKLTADAAGGRRAEGVITAVLERTHDHVVGTYQQSRKFGFVVPDNKKFTKDIFVPQGQSMNAVTGHKVVVQMTDYGSRFKNPEGRIIEILGRAGDPGTDVLSIIRAYNLPEEFPKEVMEQVAHIPSEVLEREKAGRRDLRNLQTVTIDGEDAKDLDDAVTIEKRDGKYYLGVHIADVSHYVKEGSPLDKEAVKRGTSVYLTDRVIPMLPRQLSNGICSLNAGVDRLALSCLMEIDEKGNIIGHEIAETLICVDRRMTYTAVKQIIEDHDEAVCSMYSDFVPMFELMYELSLLLRQKRKKRGGIDFDFPESKIILDKHGKPVDIRPYEHNSATNLIEDFMLAANETIAEDYFWQEIPFLYRTHETPDSERIQKLASMIGKFGYYLKSSHEEVHPKEFQKLLGKISGTPQEPLISRLVLRSMKQARYTTENTGHFGLAVKYYCHFTSPIRRYPDLQIHRIIKESLHGGLSERRLSHYDKILPEVAMTSSSTERRADEAEREVDKLKKVEYMSAHIGEKFDGVISGLTGYGMYVELSNTCEGLVRLESMTDDYYIYDEGNYVIVGETTGRRFGLGDRAAIIVVGTDITARTIDFELTEE
ncbi:MAG TPA: ribonuclease R [Candidatus Scybalocola faecipullorum]|nr:ribonuclease R [Candidatus Scybalocola faecipullorum]